MQRNLATGETEVEFDWRPTGARILATNTEIREDNITWYRIVEGDPLSATVVCEVEVSLDRAGWNTRTRATATMTSDVDRFIVTTTLDAFEDNVRVFARTYTFEFPATGRDDQRPRRALPVAPTIPWSWYSDPAILAIELERIFRCSWQYAGHLGELQGPGSYFASATGPVPIVITLDADGAASRLRQRLPPPRGDRRDGRQAGHAPVPLPRLDIRARRPAAGRSAQARIPLSTASCMGLVPVSVDTWGPFVFANPDPHAEPLATRSAIFRRSSPSTGSTSHSLRFNRRFAYEIRANWKIALENYLECYHCAVNHPGLVEVIDERRLELRRRGLRTSQFAPVHPRSLDGRGPIDASGELDSGQNHLWFPSLKFNVAPRPPEPLDRPGVADRPGHLRGLPRLLVR